MKRIAILHIGHDIDLTVIAAEIRAYAMHMSLPTVIIVGVENPPKSQPPEDLLEEVIKLKSNRIDFNFEPFEVEMGSELNGPCYNEFMAMHYRGLGTGRRFIPKEKNYLRQKK